MPIKSIKLKLVLANVGLIVFSALLITLPIIMIQYSSKMEETNDDAEDKILQGNLKISNFLNEPITIINNVSCYLKSHEDNQESIENFFEYLLKGKDTFSELYYSGAVPVKDGGFFWANDRWAPPSDYDQTTRAWYKAGRQTANGKISISDPYLDSVTNSMVAALSTSINRNGEFCGVAAIDIQLDELNELVAPIKLSRSGKSFLLDRSGKYVTNPDTSLLMKANFFEEFDLQKYQGNITVGKTFFTANDGKGRYFAARGISDESGWIFVTIGPRRELLENLQKNIIAILLLSLIAVGIGLLIAFIIAHTIVRPITIVKDTIIGIAEGNADLTKRIKSSSNDEIGILVAGFNKFSEKLQNIIGDVKHSKESLIDAGNDLSDSSHAAASAITEILANIESMHSQINNQHNSVTETAGAVNEIASNIESLERMIDNQSQSVSQASAAVEEMIGNIRSVNNSVEKMADSFTELEETARNGISKQTAMNQRIEQIESQSQMLQEANQAIASIAEQTNLLAMNAAIEAAHAGEAGKGFSVVADEIRKLSETSQEQSMTIGEQLNAIRESITTVVGASEQSSQAFGSVSDKIQETDQLVRQIKAAMIEQMEGSQQISDALHTMNDSTIEVHSASAEMSEGNKAILEEVKNLQNATTLMKGSMEEMSIGAQKINECGTTLGDVSGKMSDSIKAIGSQIDQFKV